MKLTFKLLAVLLCTASILSCKSNKPAEFVQPRVLEKNSAFNLAGLNFNEDVLQLISKSLDTNDVEFKGKDYEVFKIKDSFVKSELNDIYFPLGEKRYFFKTIDLDSIARFDSLYFYRAGIETDQNKKMISMIGNAKFKEKKDLDKYLSQLFRKLGKTTEEMAIKADDKKVVDDAKAGGMSDEAIKFIGLGEGSKYDLLDYGDNAYFEWKLKDRYIQVSLSKDREISISTNAENNSNIEYLYVQFLVIKKEEYEKIEKLQFDRAVKLKHESAVLKPYELHALKPTDNWRFFTKLRKAWGEKL